MRYAVYFCPAAGSGLDVFGREWLSISAILGMTPARLRALLAVVRRYGWHGTISAPAALVATADYSVFRQAVIVVAKQVEPFELPLRLDSLAGFLALRPAGDETAIQALAKRCVRSLNALRAPLNDAAWQRRAKGLDEVELSLLREFGYPYVMERYRFHMTLSAPASESEEQLLRKRLAPMLVQLPTAQIDALTICREGEPGQPFEQIERIALGKGHTT